ncbi:MAG: EAL domain-containing protein [Solirubrobacteraceae bacterium]
MSVPQVGAPAGHRMVLDDMMPIYDTDAHVLRARRTAALTRTGLGLMGIALVLLDGGLLTHRSAGIAGFAVIVVTSILQLLAPRLSWMRTEESLSGVAGVLIIGLQTELVSVISIIWLAAVASGVLARGGRVHWIGRTVVLCALALPIVRTGHLTLNYAALCGTTIGLLLTSGRLTRELNRLLHQARYDADHDDLTGLLSYTAFRTILQQAVEQSSRSKPASLLLLDLERFGIINKTHGHAAGDALLAAVGERLREAAGADCPVGRLGGDEFAVIASTGEPLLLARVLLDALPPRSEDDPRPISACVGVSQTPADGENGEALLRAADIALRVAKRGGLSGQVSAYVGGSLSGNGERSARRSLDNLIEGRGLSMAVQPIVDPRTGAIHAYEALARFGRRSTDSPLHWLAVAEEFGERDLLERACLKAALELFETRPPGVCLSVNLSAPVLLDRRTLDMLESQVDLSGLIVEVTEEALVQSEAQLQQAIDPLRARGAKLAVDDMGAGYSGLRQITTVHPSYLKLDRSLITGIDDDDDRQALVAALVSYAEHVDSLLVAEGIETPSELSTLIDLHVPLVQGFYLGRPAAPWPQVVLSHAASLRESVSAQAV